LSDNGHSHPIKIFCAVLAAGLVILGLFILWHENERRSSAVLVAAAGCPRWAATALDGLLACAQATVDIRRLCQFSRPLIDYRGVCRESPTPSPAESTTGSQPRDSSLQPLPWRGR
jgi:hypothetical protein